MCSRANFLRRKKSVDEIQCLMSFSPECWQPLGPGRPATGQQLPMYCKPVGRGGHKQAKQFKPGQSRGRFTKLIHALQKLQVISRMSSCNCETNVLESGQD